MDRDYPPDDEPPGSKIADGVQPGRKGQLYGAAATELRSLISTGKMPAGHRLRERELCETLGISRTPLREAIRALATEGLVTLLPNRSAVVSEMDLAEVEQLYQVVAALEGLAAELAIERVTRADLDEIEALHRQLVAHHRDERLDEYFAANQAIHRRLVEISGNAVLLWVWDMLALRVNRARYSTNLKPERWADATREHGEILEALKKRERTEFPALLRAHIFNGLCAIQGNYADPADGAGRFSPAPPR